MVKIAILGTGLMGEPLAMRLLAAGVSVVAYNRTPTKLDELKEAGATVTSDAREAIAAGDCAILMLSDKTAITEVLLAESRSLLSGRTIIQMGTISPAQSRDIQQQVEAAGGDYLEAPVLGSIPQVKSRELLVMVGATAAQFQRWSGLLQNFGPQPLHIGPVGTAAALKLALNQLIASLTAGFALSLGFIQREGVEIETFMEILRESALYAPTFDKKLSRMRDRNFANPNFPTKHLLKDVELFLEQAGADGLNCQGLNGVGEIVAQAMAMGLAEADYSAIYAAIDPANHQENRR